MNNVFKILDEIGKDSSRTVKEKLLKENVNNDDLKKVLYYTFNPYLIFGIGAKTFKNVQGDSEFNNLFDMLDYVLKNNTGTDETKLKVNKFISSQVEEDQEWIKRILLKDLKIGISDKTINKIWKDLIPTFDVMLAKKYFDNKNKVNSKFIITTKLDGIRCVILKENGQIKIISRQGKIFEGLNEIEKEAAQLPDNMVYDGEILADNTEGLDSKTLYRKTMNLATKKGIKIGLIHNCFDIIPIDEFKKGESKDICINRKNELHKIFNELSLKHIIEVPMLYVGNDKNKITELLNKAISQDQEGVMVNLADKTYKCKRTDVILKVKKMQSCDCKVIGFEEGTGRLQETLGAILINYKDNVVKVGSGYSDEDRKDIWNNRDNLLGKIIEVQYFEETENQNDDSLSLRFPVFLRIRNDKTEPSYF